MAQKQEEAPIKAYLGSDATFKGTLSFDGTVRVDGKFEGQVNTNDTFIVGETGEINADVAAGTIICKGIMRGTIIATNKIEMHPSGRIVGNVQTPAIKIELGAVLDGNCSMTETDSKKTINLVKDEKK